MLHRRFPIGRFGLALAALLAASVLAQPAKRPLTHSDFDGWRNIATPTLSRDGRWLAYSFMPQDGDGDLIVREVATGKENRVAVGALPPPSPTAADENAPPEAPPPPRVVRIAFTSDSRFAIATTYPAKVDVAAARKAKKKPDEMPRGGLVILDLGTGDTTRVNDVKSFQVPAKGGAWLAFLKEGKPEPKSAEAKEPAGEPPAPEARDDAETPAPASQPATAAAIPPPTAPETTATSTTPAPTETRPTPPATPPREAAATGVTTSDRTFGTEFVLRNLTRGEERSFTHVLDYSLARDGRTLLFTVSARMPTENGVFALTPGDDAKPVALLAGRGRYTRLTWDREQTQATFVSDRVAANGSNAKSAKSNTSGKSAAKTSAARGPRFTQYLWKRGEATAHPIVTSVTKGLGPEFVVSDRATASFSRDGKKLFVAAAPAAKTSRAPTASSSLPDEEKVTADLWHWRDGFVQSMQKVRASQERNRTYRGVLDLDSGAYTQLADPTLASISYSDDGTRVLGYDDRAYRSRVDYDGRFSDVYVVDAKTGARQLVLKQLRGESGAALQWSPDGKWAYYYQARSWHLIDTATGATRPVSDKLKLAFHNEDHDRPEPPPAYGSAGWLKDSSSFLAYDRYDVWQFFPDGRAPRNLTAGHGRAQKIQLRVQRIEPFDADDDERGLDPARPLVLRGESEETRASGFFQTSVSATGAPARLLWGDKNFRYVGRAQDADALLVTASRFDEFPDVHVTDSSFAALTKCTDGGAQRAPFAWGGSELIRFKSADGVLLSASLIKPPGFDPKKKYPLLVYIYERLSQTMHNFIPPAPGTSINASFYASNGYVVLMPDIVYKTGQPGQSALRCVLPAIDAVARLGFVDANAIGIQGHSWGGYQIAYMLTQTSRFRAAVAGAPVGNMTSAYSGIRWGSGLPRQFQYETGQSRIGRSLQAAPQAFIDNSPIFHIERVTTPVLMMANDHDDAVPWYQGIELFLALRRHLKPSWLFNYNNEFHGLRRRADQKDWARRMHQFFEHYLKGAPAPEWLENGIPYIDREEEKLNFNAPATKPETTAQQ